MVNVKGFRVCGRKIKFVLVGNCLSLCADPDSGSSSQKVAPGSGFLKITILELKVLGKFSPSRQTSLFSRLKYF